MKGRRRAEVWAAVGVLALTGCSTGRPTPPSALGPPVTTPTSAPPARDPLPIITTTTPSTEAPTTTTTIAARATAPLATLTLGQWSPIGLIINGVPTLTASLLQGRPGGPLTGVVQINGAITRPALYAGTAEPGGTWPNQAAVAPAAQADLIAAFNSGFHTYASGGGWFDHGRAEVALRAGAASLVIRADGSATVGMWDRDVSLTADVVSVRQNLGLLVDGGADQSGSGSWGATLGGVAYTWRSGVGVDAAGNLLYAGGGGLDAQSLAHVLMQAGALRAMELDINPQWVAFAYYTGPNSGTNLTPDMNYPPSHWLSGSSRDFIAIFAR